jgi:hypothetical protein
MVAVDAIVVCIQSTPTIQNAGIQVFMLSIIQVREIEVFRHHQKMQIVHRAQPITLPRSEVIRVAELVGRH